MQNLLEQIRGNKKMQIGVMVAVVVLLVVILGAVVLFQRAADSQQQAETVSVSFGNSNETIGSRRIDGVPVDPSVANLLPAAVMIENLITVRPQAGLQSASVVYEALAEGGITRFLAVYATDEELEKIGPVRSARHYYVDWAQEYGGLYMHAGGSPLALSALRDATALIDINQLSGDHPYFYRDSALQAPHNLFTTSELILFYLRDNDMEDEQGSFEPWKFSGTPAQDDQVATEITIPFSSSSYEARYEYDATAGVYKRFNAGEPHTDQLTGTQITVKNVVIQYASSSLLEADSGRLDIEVIGAGDALFFRDGVVATGSWKKGAEGERTFFYTEDGQEYSFAAGNIWIAAVPSDREITYN